MCIRLALKLSNFKSIVALLKRFEGNSQEPALDSGVINRYRSSVISAHKVRGLFFINCLDICVAFRFLMKRRGIPTDLRFGMNTAGGKLKAHAWLEYKGCPLTLNSNIRDEYIAFREAII